MLSINIVPYANNYRKKLEMGFKSLISILALGSGLYSASRWGSNNNYVRGS